MTCDLPGSGPGPARRCGKNPTDDGTRDDGRRDDDVGHGLIGLLVVVLLVLTAAALLKYLFSRH
jgi:hypothetical protein